MELDSVLQLELELELDSVLQLELELKLDSVLQLKLEVELDSVLQLELELELDSVLQLELELELDSVLQLELELELDSLELEVELDSVLQLELEVELDSVLQLKLEVELDSVLQLKLEVELDSVLQLKLEEPPGNIYRTITSTLKALLEDTSLTFQKSSWYGDDLCPAAWDYVFSLDLLCAQLGWIWTVSHVIRKDVWPNLKIWLLRTQTEEKQFKNVSVAAIIRLLGRLGQQGLKENMAASVEDLAKSITEFGRQKRSKDLPWEVQLAVVYATHNLAPSNPKVALKSLESWKKELTKPVPPAVTKCLKHFSFL
ncbi:hypothetical protein HF521_016683 [Silurus meridionalis]|uniref:Little elongation complex subunit 1 C-terminal domain-containing protein n=1 Tax=Silurus meridionalis TaxID=175797 RepID=A0A8T0BTS3_SILME|nr:hypothetical protein HF521_016683 [Silurus meridionalis]